MLNVCHESIDHGVTLLTRLMWNVNTKWWDPNVCVCVFFFKFSCTNLGVFYCLNVNNVSNDNDASHCLCCCFLVQSLWNFNAQCVS